MSDYPSTRTAPTHVLAIVSLVLALLGFTPILPLVGSIGAIISGRIARREILAAPEQYSGEGLARAAVILGWIGVGLGALALLCVCAAFLFFMPVRIDGGPMPAVVTVIPVTPVPIPVMP